jgi:hypothetical protein
MRLAVHVQKVQHPLQQKCRRHYHIYDLKFTVRGEDKERRRSRNRAQPVTRTVGEVLDIL